jgi:GNAT superfamily N-acetyltransferase
VNLNLSSKNFHVRHIENSIDDDVISKFINSSASRLDRELSYTLTSSNPSKNIHNFIAELNQEVIGVLTGQFINREYGWLNAARIMKEHQGKGIFNRLRTEAENWLIQSGITHIRTSITSDNLTIRNIFERKGYKPICFSIEPNTYLDLEKEDTSAANDLALVVNEELYNSFKQKLRPLGGNVMIDNFYVPMNKELWDKLLQEKRIYTNYEEDTFLILSEYLPTVLTGFVVGEGRDQYTQGAKTLKSFAVLKMIPEVVIHAPSIREAVKGVTNAGFSWTHPYSLLTYEKSITERSMQ